MTDLGAPGITGPGEGRELPVVGLLKVSAEQSGGAFEVIEGRGPASPPPHVHRDREEFFYVTEGRLTFVLGREEFVVEPRGSVLVPRGTRHGFTTTPDARYVLVIAPAGLAGFFEDLGRGVAGGRSPHDVRAELAARYDSLPAE